MEFKFNRDNTLKGSLIPINKDFPTIKIEIEIHFTSCHKLEEVLKSKCPTRQNQDIVAQSIRLSKHDYQNLNPEHRYSGEFTALMDLPDNIIDAYKILLGNIALKYSPKNTHTEGDLVTIDMVNITLFPYGTYGATPFE